MRKILLGLFGILALVGLMTTQAAARGCCRVCCAACSSTCGVTYGRDEYGSFRAYYYRPSRSYLRRYDPRWTFAAAYYNPPRYSVRVSRRPVLVRDRGPSWYWGW